MKMADASIEPELRPRRGLILAKNYSWEGPQGGLSNIERARRRGSRLGDARGESGAGGGEIRRG